MMRVIASTSLLLCLFAGMVSAQGGPCGEDPFPSDPNAPFGSFGLVPNTASGVLPLFGWALAEGGVQRVEVFVDGAPAGQALYGIRRPGVTALFPGFPNSGRPGWGFNLDTTHYLPGQHTLTVRVLGNGGKTSFLNPRATTFSNLTHNLVPFGSIDFPDRNATLIGACNLDNPRFLSVVQGWALDVGVETGDTGVGYVELLLDGVIMANSRRDCAFLPSASGAANCYGLPRLDLEETYPFAVDAPNGGFRFVLDVGFLIATNRLGEGQHNVTIRSGDISGQVANIDEFPVAARCAEGLGNVPAIGAIEPSFEELAGTEQLVGWALDFEGVSQVLISVDGAEVGEATYGFPRPGVTQQYPSFPDSANPGFVYLLDTLQFSNGRHDVQAVAVDGSGGRTIIGEASLTIANP